MRKFWRKQILSQIIDIDILEAGRTKCWISLFCYKQPFYKQPGLRAKKILYNFWGADITCCLKIVFIMIFSAVFRLVKFNKIHGIFFGNFEPQKSGKTKQPPGLEKSEVACKKESVCQHF